MPRIRAVVWVLGSIFLSCLPTAFGQAPEAPILYVTGKLLYNSTIPNVISPNWEHSTNQLLMVSHNLSLSEWDFRNISFLSMQTISGAMVVGASEIYTFGYAPLTGQGNESGGYYSPRLLANFEPEHVVKLSSTDTYTVALISNGSVYIWGSGDRPEYIPGYNFQDPKEILGLGDTATAFTITEITNFTNQSPPNISKIFVGTSSQTFAIDDQASLWGWGSNNEVLPTEDNDFTVKYPTLLVGFDGLKISQISCAIHAVALLQNGTYICWGSNLFNACGSNITGTPGLIVGAPPPDGRKWIKLATGYGFTYAIASDHTLWAWGRLSYKTSIMTNISYAPIQNNSACRSNLTLPSGQTNVTLCDVHQVILAPHRRNAKIIDILESFYFVFALTDLGEIFLISSEGFGDSSDPLFWRPFPYSIPNGNAIDFSKSQTSGSTVFFLTKSDTPCPEPKPSFVDPASIHCNNGVWILTGESVQLSSDLTLDSPIVITGNLNVSSPITITAPVQGTTIGKPLLTAENCIEQMENLNFQLEITEDQLKQSKLDPIVLINIDGACSYTTLLETDVTQPKNCRKAVVTLQSSTTPSGRTQIRALFTINNTSCNTWWIILVSVLGGVILVVILLALFYTSAKKKCRPYAKRGLGE